MKKIIAFLLALTLCLSLSACFSKEEEKHTENDEIIENITEDEVKKEESEAEDNSNAEITEKPQAEKPESTPAENKKPSAPAQQEQKPAAPEADNNKPSEDKITDENEKSETLGKTLLSDFRKKATSGMSAENIANELLKNPVIKFAGGVVPVEEGLLTGFDNTEINGFKSGYMFAPMIGSIPFVGYIFELEDGADVSSFTKLLKDSANMRWNICVSADETIIDSSGNMVFFVMCPESLEE